MIGAAANEQALPRAPQLIVKHFWVGCKLSMQLFVLS